MPDALVMGDVQALLTCWRLGHSLSHRTLQAVDPISAVVRCGPRATGAGGLLSPKHAWISTSSVETDRRVLLIGVSFVVDGDRARCPRKKIHDLGVVNVDKQISSCLFEPIRQ